jgi:hypothetical protein
VDEGLDRPEQTMVVTAIKYDPNRIQKWCSLMAFEQPTPLLKCMYPGRAEVPDATMGMGTFSLVVLIQSKR